MKQYEKIGKLTKDGNSNLEKLTPVEHYYGEESYTEYPFVEENGKVSHRRR